MDSNPANNNSEHANNPSHKGKSRWLRWLKGFGVAAGIGYAVVTYLMWRDSHNNFVIDERAWMNTGVSPFNAVPPEGTPIIVNVTTFNNGKTAARKVMMECVVAIKKNTDSVQFDYTHPHVVSDMGYVTPNYFNPVQCVRGEAADRPDVVNKIDFDDFTNGRAYMVIYGRGTYEDVFGDKHWWTFCSWKGFYTPGTYTARGCTDYADTGDGPTPPK